MADLNDQIQELYVAYFGRPADYLGLQYWTKAAATATGYAQMVDAFATSSEYQAKYAGMDNRVVVDTVYENLFGRHAESAGIDYWASLLDKGAITIGNVVTSVAAGAQGSDAYVFDARVEVAELFTSHLDQAAERLAYTDASANALAAAYLAKITDAATAGLALETANIDYLISQITGGLQLPQSASTIHIVGVPEATGPVHA